MGPEQVKPCPVGHGGRDGHNPVVLACELDQGIGEDLRVSRQAGRRGQAGIGVVGPQAVELLLPIERRLVAAALLRQNMQQHRPVFCFQKLECLHQQRQVVAVDGAKVLQSELFKQDRGPEHALGSLFGTARQDRRGLAAEPLHDAVGRVVKILVVLIGDDAVKVAGNGPHVAVDGPLVVVEHHDHPLGLLCDVVERLEGDSIGKSGVAGHGDYMLLAAGKIAGHGHSQGSGERCARVAGSERIVFALGAEHEAIQPARLANCLKAIQPAGEYLVDICLVTYVEEKLVLGSIEDRVQR